MRKANVYMHGEWSGQLVEFEKGQRYQFNYREGYDGPPVSLTMPVAEGAFSFTRFPPFFEGLLPEGVMLDGLLRQLKIDRGDLFAQLLATGEDLVGAVTVKPVENE